MVRELKRMDTTDRITFPANAVSKNLRAGMRPAVVKFDIQAVTSPSLFLYPHPGGILE